MYKTRKTYLIPSFYYMLCNSRELRTSQRKRLWDTFDKNGDFVKITLFLRKMAMGHFWDTWDTFGGFVISKYNYLRRIFTNVNPPQKCPKCPKSVPKKPKKGQKRLFLGKIVNITFFRVNITRPFLDKNQAKNTRVMFTI